MIIHFPTEISTNTSPSGAIVPSATMAYLTSLTLLYHNVLCKKPFQTWLGSVLRHGKDATVDWSTARGIYRETLSKARKIKR